MKQLMILTAIVLGLAQNAMAEVLSCTGEKGEKLETLPIPVCQKCHREDGFFARGTLKRQQIGTITHLVDRGEMPPPGFHMSEQDKKQLRKFIYGF